MPRNAKHDNHQLIQRFRATLFEAIIPWCPPLPFRRYQMVIAFPKPLPISVHPDLEWSETESVSPPHSFGLHLYYAHRKCISWECNQVTTKNTRRMGLKVQWPWINTSIKITSPQSIVLRLASDVQPVWMEYSHPFFILGRHSSDRAWPKEKKEVEKSCWNWFGEPETGSSLAYKSRVFRRRSIWRKNLFKTRSQNYLMLLRPEDALMNYRQYSKGSYFGIIQSSLILE